MISRGAAPPSMELSLVETVVFEPVWSWPLVLLAAIGMPILVLVMYPPRVRHLSRPTRRLLIGARLAAVLVLIFAMFRPAIQYTETDSQLASLMIVADRSRSMTTTDGPVAASRRQYLVQTLATNREKIEQLGKLVEIRAYDFDTTLHPIDLALPAPFSETADGEQSAYGMALDELLRESQSQRMIGVLLLGDGAQRAVAPFETEPRSVARRAAEVGVPLFPVLFGESDISAAGLDIAVEDLAVSPIVFVKNHVPVNAKLHITGAAGQSFVVQLLVEDRSGRASNEDGELKVPAGVPGSQPSLRIRVDQPDQTIPVELSYVPQLPGEYRIAVSVEPVDGELKQTNNRRETLVTVQKGGVNVAYFDTVRDEQEAIRQIGESRQIQLDFYWVRSGEFANQSRIEPSIFEPGRYDVFIIGDVPAAAFGNDLLQRLAQRVGDGSGLMMTGGLFSFGAGGYANTPLDSLLPVKLDAREIQNDGQIAADLHYDADLKMRPTPDGLAHAIMRLSTEKNAEAWNALPPLRGASKLQRRNAFVQILAESAEGYGLLFATNAARTRTLAFAGDSTWRWCFPWQNGTTDFRAEHQRFWRQVILWLARKELDTDQPVWVRVDPRNFAPGSPVPIELGMRDANGEPVTDAEFQIRIDAPQGEPRELTAIRTAENHIAEFRGAEAAGIYRVTVAATRNGERVPGDAVTRFLVDDRDLELDNPAADPEMFKDLAATTGGRVLAPDQVGTFLDELIAKGPPSLTATRTTRVTLWDNWWLLALFVLLLTAEWAVRKKRGLV